jgi:hypothetical protein
MNPLIRMLQPQLLETVAASSLEDLSRDASRPCDGREPFHAPARSPVDRHDHPAARIRGHRTKRPPRRQRSYR